MSMQKMSNCTVIALLMCVVQSVSAQGWYIGAGLGNTGLDLSATEAELKTEVNFDETAGVAGIDSGVDIDDDDSGIKLFGGYRFNERFAVEAGYADLGEGSVVVSLTAEQAVPLLGIQEGDRVILTETDRVSGFFGAAVGRLPLSDRLTLQGRAGLYVYELEYDFSQTDTTGLVGGNYTESDSEGDVDPFYGLSLDIGLHDQFSVSAFYEIYGVDGDDADFIGASASYTFP